ncbi:MAG TPA: sensor histidine kinase [Conexibacter sp.]|nr:sensor histidine kinase [Conexibacter sp.]
MSAIPATATPATQPPAGFRHKALMYEGERGFLEGTLPFLREGIALGQPALVVVAPRKIARLREALGEDARHVHFDDMRHVGVNPARIIPAWNDFFERAGAGGRPLRGIGEPIWAERSAAELVECHRHESLLNLAFADAADFRLLCPYDTTALAPAVVAEARRTHPLVSEDGSVHESTCFHGMEAAGLPCTAPLPPAPAAADELPIDARSLAMVRAAVTRHAVRAELAPGRIEDVVLAVNELATNSIVHGGGRGTLHVWMDADALVCEVSDDGTLELPLAGRHRPAEGEIGHYGLWLVNHLCDFVEQRTPPGGGNVVRVTMRGE